ARGDNRKCMTLYEQNAHSIVESERLNFWNFVRAEGGPRRAVRILARRRGPGVGGLGSCAARPRLSPTVRRDAAMNVRRIIGFLPSKLRVSERERKRDERDCLESFCWQSASLPARALPHRNWRGPYSRD